MAITNTFIGTLREAAMEFKFIEQRDGGTVLNNCITKIVQLSKVAPGFARN